MADEVIHGHGYAIGSLDALGEGPGPEGDEGRGPEGDEGPGPSGPPGAA